MTVPPIDYLAAASSRKFEREKRKVLDDWGATGDLRDQHAAWIDARHKADLPFHGRPFVTGPRDIAQARERLVDDLAALIVLEQAYMTSALDFAGRCPADMAERMLAGLKAEMAQRVPELLRRAPEMLRKAGAPHLENLK